MTQDLIKEYLQSKENHETYDEALEAVRRTGLEMLEYDYNGKTYYAILTYEELKAL